jgi:hypothetical protein
MIRGGTFDPDLGRSTESKRLRILDRSFDAIAPRFGSSRRKKWKKPADGSVVNNARRRTFCKLQGIAVDDCAP